MITWSDEWPRIQVWSARRGIDPFLVAAVRVAENGGEGKEFGVLSVVTQGYEDQVRVCTRTLAGLICSFAAAGVTQIPFVLSEVSGFKKVTYSAQLVHYIQEHYAPHNVANDPTNLNNNWFSNVMLKYRDFTQAGKPF